MSLYNIDVFHDSGIGSKDCQYLDDAFLEPKPRAPLVFVRFRVYCLDGWIALGLEKISQLIRGSADKQC